MRALFDDVPVANHKNLISQGGVGEAVGNRDRTLALAQAVGLSEDSILRNRVKSGGGLVQDHKFALLEIGAGKADIQRGVTDSNLSRGRLPDDKNAEQEIREIGAPGHVNAEKGIYAHLLVLQTEKCA